MTTHSPEEEETPETNSPWSVSMEAQSYRTQPTPCLRECLRECIRHADEHSTLKLMIRVLYWNTRKRKQLINIVLNFNVELDVIAIQEVNNEDQIPYGAEGCLHSQATRAWDVDRKEGVDIFSVYSPAYGGQWTIPIKELMSMPARKRLCRRLQSTPPSVGRSSQVSPGSLWDVGGIQTNFHLLPSSVAPWVAGAPELRGT
ncbi:hypothetical protein E4U50_006165 [Claviceps purpurea]|nr:hypothetical protein E4U12_006079 [Claviceps purpurea]KAG6202596.1 hypothetical protein E4U50_006165 [Claviceps purpurea]